MSHGSSNENKLVRMANQIAAFYRRLPPAQAASEVANHIAKFWEPRMRQAIYAHLDAGGEGLDANAAAGLASLREADRVKAAPV